MLDSDKWEKRKERRKIIGAREIDREVQSNDFCGLIKNIILI